MAESILVPSEELTVSNLGTDVSEVTMHIDSQSGTIFQWFIDPTFQNLTKLPNDVMPIYSTLILPNAPFRNLVVRDLYTSHPICRIMR